MSASLYQYLILVYLLTSILTLIYLDGGRRNYRNEGMVYISNIPYDVRWMELKDLVREKAGEVRFEFLICSKFHYFFALFVSLSTKEFLYFLYR